MSLKRIEVTGGHKYELDGRDCPGVTTLIKGGTPNEALKHWAARTVAEEVADMPQGRLLRLHDGDRDAMIKELKAAPWRKSKKAAAKGTEIHGYAEKLINGADVDVPIHLAGYVKAAVDFMNEWRPAPVVVEAVVGSRRHHYSGTVDLICDLPDGRRALMDYKTSGSGIYPETALQLAAYRNAEFYLADGAEQSIPDLGINCAYAIWIKDGSYDVIPVETGPRVFAAFLSAAHITLATQQWKTWIGEPETWSVHQ